MDWNTTDYPLGLLGGKKALAMRMIAPKERSISSLVRAQGSSIFAHQSNWKGFEQTTNQKTKAQESYTDTTAKQKAHMTDIIDKHTDNGSYG